MLNEKRKGLSGIALATLVFMGTLNGLYRPSYNVYASEDYHSWRQMDERWANIPIGNTTIGASGCLVTSIAIMAVHSGSANPDSFNPGLFASAINGINGFDAYGGLKWSAVPAVVPDVQIVGVNQFQSYDEAGKAEEIRSAMENGYYVICYVGNHWVFVEDVSGNDVYMIDPAKDDVLMFDAYNNYNITQYEILTGKNLPSFSFEDQTTSAVTTSFVTTEAVTTTYSTEDISETTTEFIETTTTTTESTETTTTTTETDIQENTTTTESTETTTTTTTIESTTTETTTTETTTVPETETTTTTTSSSSQTTKNDCSSEFYYSGEETTCVYTTSGEVIAEIQNGYMLDVREIRNGYGLVSINGVDGWIDMSQMAFNFGRDNHMKGDINGDGEINLYDLSLLNDYLKSLKTLPEGVSILSKSEIETADINGDGVTDNNDVIEYLSIICK